MDGVSEGTVVFTVMLGSVCNGVGGAIFWVAQGKYLSNIVMICEEKSGLYTSIFWSITLGSQIFAYLSNSIILGSFDVQVLFTVSTLITFIGIVIFGLLPDPKLPENYTPVQENAG